MDIYGILVPYKPLTNFELLDFAEKLHLGLRGVFMRNNLLAFPHKEECAIVNFNKADESGSHWVCYHKKMIVKYILIVTGRLFYKKFVII